MRTGDVVMFFCSAVEGNGAIYSEKIKFLSIRLRRGDVSGWACIHEQLCVMLSVRNGV